MQELMIGHEKNKCSIGMELSHEKESEAKWAPIALADELRVSDGWLDLTMKRLAKEKKAVFVVLENDGFEVSSN